MNAEWFTNISALALDQLIRITWKVHCERMLYVAEASYLMLCFVC